jgi:hypothetical protein
MNYDKNYFLDQLRNGQDISAMGQQIADAMNAAIADFSAEQEAARKAEAERVAKVELTAKKKAIGEEIVDLFREYAALTGNTAMDELEITDDDMDTLVEALDQTFALMGAMKELKVAIDSIPADKIVARNPKANINTSRAKSDDEVLADFLATILK